MFMSSFPSGSPFEDISLAVIEAFHTMTGYFIENPVNFIFDVRMSRVRFIVIVFSAAAVDNGEAPLSKPAG